MARAREVFVCNACGRVHARWMGKCPDCGTWDSLEAQARQGDASPERDDAPVPRPIADVPADTTRRISTGIDELDRVLGGRGAEPGSGAGGGLVPGSVVLIGGAPGIGKSTLLLQACAAMAARGLRVLYASSEESASQVRLRAERLGSCPASLFVLSETSLTRILDQARSLRPGVLVVDSIQMVHVPSLDALPGSMAQLRRCGADLVAEAKASGLPVLLVGHVTKDGRLAGPRLIEHLVDAVIQFEGDRYHAHRVVRALKNRFGTTMEIGLFEMGEKGLRGLPGGAPIQPDTPRPGSALCPIVSGTRSLLVEIQALTATGFLGAAKRKASGIDPNRLAMIVAVLEQHAGLRLADRDIFASSVGGVRVLDPGADLALLAAIAGAQLRRASAPATAWIGEVGLGGEVRPVSSLESRLHEARRLGCRRVVLARDAASTPLPKGLEADAVRSIDQAIERLA